MLSPYVCVACEKVILSKEDIPTLISLFSKIRIGLVENAPEIPANAVIPREWSVFSMWDNEPGDEAKNYFICTQLLYPDKTAFGDASKIKMNIEPNKRSQNIMTFNGFPLGQTGLYSVHTWIEENQKKVFGPIEVKIELEIIAKQ